MSLAIVDAAAEPIGEPGFRATSHYLAPIANTPLIGHVFDELAAGGVERAVVIAHADARRELEEALDGGNPWGLEVSYSEASESHGPQAILTQTRQALSSEPVLVCPADCLFPGQVAAMRSRFCAGDVDCVLLTPGDGSSSSESRMFATPVIFGLRTREILDESTPQSRDAHGLAEIMLAAGYRVATCEAAEQWHYSDSTERLLAANRMVLDELSVPAFDGSFPDDNEVHGRVAISPQARVSNSTLYGPVVIDRDAIVEDSYIGPYTAIGRGARVSGTELDNTMVLPSAEIRHPGSRIEASIIGEGASISRSFELPRGLHLRLRPGSHVTLS